MNKSLFLGSKNLGLKILKKMHQILPDSVCAVATLEEKNDQRGCPNDFRAFCDTTKTPFRIIRKNADLTSVIKEFHPDVCIVNGYYRILNKKTLDRFPLGCAGIHGSLLPAFRGGSPLVWAILNGEKRSGLSLFYFDEGMDTGDIIAQKSFDIGEDETIADILTKVEELSIEVIKENYLAILDGSALRHKQNHQKATFAAMRQPSDGKIDWKWSSKRIYDFIRAQTKPYPGAFTMNGTDKKLIIWKSYRFGKPYYGPSGKVVHVSDSEAIVTCGNDTAIVIQKAQFENESEKPVSQTLKFNEVLR